MAYRLKFSKRALRETGEAQEWYELQSPGLGEEFIAAMKLYCMMPEIRIVGLKTANPSFNTDAPGETGCLERVIPITVDRLRSTGQS